MKTYILTLTMLVLTISASAQGDSERRARIESQRVAFITTELELTTEEAKVFWPIYNEYKKKEREITRRLQVIMRQEVAENDADAKLEEYFNLENQRITLQKSHVVKMKEAIPPAKILKLFKVEKEFVRTMLKEYRRRGRQ